MTGEPVPVIDWDAPDHEWLTARRAGLGASEVAAALGFSQWATPWQVWAVKSGHIGDADLSDDEAVALGIELEPWLVVQAARILGEPVDRTPARLYAHPVHGWRMASPDAQAKTGPLVECKTAGLVNTWVGVADWEEGRAPLAYEIQVRWQMHVMDVVACHIIALVAGLGLVLVTVDRDLAIEAELVRQVDQWWQRHVVGGIEPPLGGADLDAVAQRWPTPAAEQVDLDGTDAAGLLAARRDATHRLAAAETDKNEVDAQLRGLIGPYSQAYLDGRIAFSLPAVKSRVDWKAAALDVAEQAGIELDPEDYRPAAGRRLTIAKEYK